MEAGQEAPLTRLRCGRALPRGWLAAGVGNVGGGLWRDQTGAAPSSHPMSTRWPFPIKSPHRPRRSIQASAGNLKRVSLELGGGKSPDIVFCRCGTSTPRWGRAQHGGVRQHRARSSCRHALFATQGRMTNSPRRWRPYGRNLKESARSRSLSGPVGPLSPPSRLERVPATSAVGPKRAPKPAHKSGGAPPLPTAT